MEGGCWNPTLTGVPQGGVASPLWSNIFLTPFDRRMAYVRSRQAGERVMASVRRLLTRQLRLTVHETKSAVDRPWNRTFLGFTC
ncbi:MAG TPA: group II intron reverse transcriptase/maturase, partial [Candidatus Tectomicrobia bacterium]|nr:group II intron reverse transcriptase/maturase [Candidatus Tectomicrobia bacterium]